MILIVCPCILACFTDFSRVCGRTGDLKQPAPASGLKQKINDSVGFVFFLLVLEQYFAKNAAIHALILRMIPPN